MTAVRVIDLHTELSDVPSGSFTHTQLDQILTGSQFLLLSGSTSLTNARRFVAGPGIIVNDGGPGGIFAVSASAASTQLIWNEIPSGALNGSNRTYVLQYVPIDRKLMFFRNGVLQASGSTADFLQSGSALIFNTDVQPPVGNELLHATYERSL